METKNGFKKGLQIFFIILLVIIIIVMGISLTKTNQKLEELQNQVNSLNGTISVLQGKIDGIQEIINSNNSNDNGTTENKSNNSNNSNEIIENVEYEVISDGYSDYESKIISDYQQYLELVKYIDSYNNAYGNVFNFDSNKYNEQYFDTKSLAILSIATGTSMNKLKSIDISIRGNTLICNADIDYTESDIITMDMCGKVLLVEFDKSVTRFEINK